MKLKDFLSYFLALVLMAWIAFILLKEKESLLLIARLDLYKILVSLGITCLIYVVNGIQIYYLIEKSSGVKMNKADLLVLPASMNLWSYLLPFRGGLIYSMIYIKMKYKIQLTQGFSIGLFTFLLSTAVAGMFGLYISWSHQSLVSVLGVVSLLLFLSPVMAFYFKGISAQLMKVDLGVFNRLNRMFHDSLEEFNHHLTNVRSTAFIILTILLSIALYVYWVYWAVYSFGIDLSLESVVLLALALRLSVIARFIPGNLGVQELISGIAVEMSGGSIAEGLLIALFIRTCALVLGILFGIYAILTNIDEFKTISVKELWTKFRNY